MRKLLLVIFVALRAQAAWVELHHGPFTVYSSAGAEPARLALNHLEQFRYAVGEAAGKAEPTFPWPITVVVQKPGKDAPAPFLGFSRDGWILAWPAGSQPPAEVFHQFALLILEHNVPRPMAPGFETALAALYSTLQVQGQRLTIGAPPPQPRRSVEWALLHRLAVTEESASRVHVFFSNLANGTEQEIAWRNAFGPPPGGGQWTPRMRAAAEEYLRAGVFTTKAALGRLLPERELKDVPALPSRIRLLPGDLALGRQAPPATIRSAYENALNEKASPAGHEGRGLAFLLEKRPDDARSEFVAATAAEGASARAYVEMERLEKDSERKHKLLEQALKLNVLWADPYIELARLESGPVRRAFHLKKAADLRPRDPRLWLDLAQAQFESKQFAESEKAMRGALGAAPDAETRAALAQRFEEFQQQRADAEAAIRKRQRDEDKAELDRLRNAALANIRQAEQRANQTSGTAKTEGAVPWWDGPPTQTIADATLERVECLGKTAKLALKYDGKALRLMVRDSGQIVVLAADSATPGPPAHLACGLQRPPRHVKIDYVPRPDAKSGTAGDAVMLQFLP